MPTEDSSRLTHVQCLPLPKGYRAMEKTILHLSANERLRLTRELILRKAGYSVISADCEKVALTLAELKSYDALILCSSIAPLAGNRVAAALRLRDDKIPVIGFGDQHRRFADISVSEFTTPKRWLRTFSDVLSLAEGFTTHPLELLSSENPPTPKKANGYAI